jgi:type VI secretion system secreted protein VgrG
MSGLNSVNDRLAEAESDDKYDGYVVGFVVENVDPEGVGRIKVQIPNVMEPDKGPVPWCLPTKDSPFGQGPDYGVYGSPKIGSPVRITFQNGDPNYPVYENDMYLKKDANPKFKEPDKWGFKDPSGNELWVDMTNQKWEFTHSSGTTLKYDGQGNLMLHVAKDQTDDVVGNRTTTIGGNDTETVQGNSQTTIQGNSQTTIQGTLNLTVSGAVTINAQSGATINVAGDANVTASGALNMHGNPINLN